MPPSRSTPANLDPWKSRSHPVPEDMGFQQAIWLSQKVGWIVLSVLLVLALLGLFAAGPFSSATAVSDRGSLAVDYQRLERNGASSSLRIRLSEGPGEGQLRIRIGPEFLKTFTIEGITPEPQDSASSRDGVDLVYPVPAAYPADIYLSLRPRRMGLTQSVVSTPGADSVRLSQFVYP